MSCGSTLRQNSAVPDPQSSNLRGSPPGRSAARPAALALAGCVVVLGCAVDVARDLPELEANRVILALNRDGIAASKVPDREHEGHFAVRIPEAELAAAVQTLHDEGLPAERSPGVLDSLGESGLVASRATEHARLIVGIAGELERSLSDINGVLTARVHLAVPEADPLLPPEAQRTASASVLLKHQGTSPPLLAQDVQRLVAGGVAGLSPDGVAVVFLSVPSAATSEQVALAQFGPLSVSRSSMPSLRWMVGVVAATNVLLLAALSFLWLRWRRGGSIAGSPREGS